MQKTVASFVTVFFIFCGIPTPTSFGAVAEPTRNALQQIVPVIAYDPSTANAPETNTFAPVASSGSAIQNPSPLSLSTNQLQGDKNSTPAPAITNSSAPQAATVPEVPQGWTRAVSNENFAVTIQYDGFAGTLKVKDLISGKESTIYQVFHNGGYPDSFTGPMDVSPDGTTVIYATSRQMYPITTHVQRIADASHELNFPGDPKTLVFNGQVAVITQTNGAKQWVDLETLKVIPPPVPSGWIRAVSNENFAFREESSYVANGIYNHFLKVRDLSIGVEQVVSSGQSFPYGRPAGTHDVSPDGSVVVYGFQNDYSTIQYGGPACVVILKRLSNLSQFLQLDGQLASVQFDQGRAVLVTRGDAVVPSYIVKLSDLTVEGTTYALTDEHATGVTYHPASNLVTQIKRVNSTDRIRIFDFGSGTGRMSLLLDRAVTTGYPADKVTLVDIYRTPQGRGIVSYSAETYAPSLDYDYKTTVLDPKTGEQLIFDGKATSVTHAGAVASYGVTHRSGATGFASVDLGSLTLTSPPVPSGWTRAVSNENFAVTIQYDGFAGTLKVKDLISGKESTIYQVFHNGGYPDSFTGPMDVSPDGTTVIYATSRQMYPITTHVQRIADASHELNFPGDPKTLVFNGQVAVITQTNGAKQWVDLETLKVIPPPVPSGWMRTPTDPNLAFQEQNETTLLMNLVDGSKRPLVMSDITSLSQAKMVQAVAKSHGFSAEGLQWTPGFEMINGSLRPVVKVRYILKTSKGDSLDTATLVFRKNGTLENIGWFDGKAKSLAGWTAVPSVSNRVYQPIAGGKVRVMDLLTGDVSDKPSSKNQKSVSSTRTGVYYVMTSTGLREIYVSKAGGETTYHSYNPVTKKWSPYKVYTPKRHK